MEIRIYQVDAFTNQAFKGNPAGVCLLPAQRPDEWMRQVAAEMNLSETAFLVKEGPDYQLRWFTPVTEVKLCGHATLASAHILFETAAVSPDRLVRFHTPSGLLTASRKQDGWIELDFPAKEEVRADGGSIARALGVEPLYVGKNQFDYLVEVESESIVRTISPDFRLLMATEARGVIVTSAASTAGFDFVSRFFAPRVGINEDPVTGSAHCCLGPYWAKKLGKASFQALQVSARTGIVGVQVAGERVKLSGQAVTVLKGVLAG